MPTDITTSASITIEAPVDAKRTSDETWPVVLRNLKEVVEGRGGVRASR